MRTHNIRFRDKLQLLLVFILAISIGISGTWLIVSSFLSARNQRIEAAQNAHRLAMYTLVSVAGESDWNATQLAGTLRVLERQVGQQFRLLTPDGMVVYQKQSERSSFHSGLTQQADVDTIAWRIQADSAGNHNLQLCAAISNGTDLFFLESLYPMETIYQARDELCNTFMGFMLVIIVVSLFAARHLSYWLTDPLTQLAQTSRDIAGGDLSRRVAIKSTDEIGQLGEDFNRMADQLSDTIIQLEHTMQRQEEFMASFAHEMRTPMTSIIGYADLMRSQDLPPDLRQQAAKYIFTEGKRLESLSNKLLDIIVLQKKQIQKQPCQMSLLIEQVYGLLSQRMEQEGIAVEIQSDDTVWNVEPDLFKTLLSNLLDNARKALPQGGQIQIFAEKQGDAWQMLVKDNGYGIPEQELPRLTEAFYRVDKARARASGGAGLGLRLCQQIVQLHHGTLTFFSKPNEGTTVQVLLRKED